MCLQKHVFYESDSNDNDPFFLGLVDGAGLPDTLFNSFCFLSTKESLDNKESVVEADLKMLGELRGLTDVYCLGGDALLPLEGDYHPFEVNLLFY